MQHLFKWLFPGNWRKESWAKNIKNHHHLPVLPTASTKTISTNIQRDFQTFFTLKSVDLLLQQYDRWLQNALWQLPVTGHPPLDGTTETWGECPPIVWTLDTIPVFIWLVRASLDGAEQIYLWPGEPQLYPEETLGQFPTRSICSKVPQNVYFFPPQDSSN